jgi:hypothetical protein
MPVAAAALITVRRLRFLERVPLITTILSERALITPPVVSPDLDRCQRLERLRRELDADRVAGPHFSAG